MKKKVIKKAKKAAPKKVAPKKAAPKKAAPKKVTKTVKTAVKKIQFKIITQPKAKVLLTGSFNNWKAGDIKLSEKPKGVYSVSKTLKKGRYEYKYVVNGIWMNDSSKESVWNDQGSMNNVITVN